MGKTTATKRPAKTPAAPAKPAPAPAAQKANTISIRMVTDMGIRDPEYLYHRDDCSIADKERFRAILSDPIGRELLMERLGDGWDGVHNWLHKLPGEKQRQIIISGEWIPPTFSCPLWRLKGGRVDIPELLSVLLDEVGQRLAMAQSATPANTIEAPALDGGREDGKGNPPPLAFVAGPAIQLQAGSVAFDNAQGISLLDAMKIVYNTENTATDYVPPYGDDLRNKARAFRKWCKGKNIKLTPIFTIGKGKKPTEYYAPRELFGLMARRRPVLSADELLKKAGESGLLRTAPK